MQTNLSPSVTVAKQVKTLSKTIQYSGKPATLNVEIRWDDCCGNGRNSFAVTGEIRYPRSRDCETCGCIHEDIAMHFPDLQPLLKWHGIFADGPSGYVTNVKYFAGERDCWGLLKDERRQIRNGRTGQLCWTRPYLEAKYFDGPDCPEETITVKWEPLERIGEGKARELDAARHHAIWPDATDEDLTTPGLEDRLAARLPSLMHEFKAAIESLGMVY